MKIEYNYEYNTTEKRWDTSLILTKDDGVQKGSFVYITPDLETKDILNGFKWQIRALEEEMTNG